MLYRWERDGVVVYRSPVLDGVGVPHAFGTRLGDADAIAGVLGCSAYERVIVRQVHGQAVYIDSAAEGAPAERTEAPRCDADAVVVRRPGALARILTADCVPILLATTDGRAVAAVHAGWRGLVAGVIQAAVAALDAPFVAAVGPAISAAHFEVGDEVADQFEPRFVQRGPGPRPHVDLPAAACSVLNSSGAELIDATDRCTYADEAFFSHRRDVTHRGAGTTGRMASVIGVCARRA